MAKLLDHLPELEGDEAAYISRLLKDMDDQRQRNFRVFIVRVARTHKLFYLVLWLVSWV
jgi:hypothetical protein